MVHCTHMKKNTLKVITKMLRLIQLLIFGHIHKWKILEQGSLTVHNDFGPPSKGDRYIYQCENCGKVKKKDLV